MSKRALLTRTDLSVLEHSFSVAARVVADCRGASFFEQPELKYVCDTLSEYRHELDIRGLPHHSLDKHTAVVRYSLIGEWQPSSPAARAAAHYLSRSAAEFRAQVKALDIDA